MRCQRPCLEAFIWNRAHLVQIVQHHEEDIDHAMITKIMDYNLFCQSRDLTEQLSPMAHAIDICQADTTELALACDTWLHLPNEHLQLYKNAVA